MCHVTPSGFIEEEELANLLKLVKILAELRVEIMENSWTCCLGNFGRLSTHSGCVKFCPSLGCCP